jgi:hypothetical protein
MTSCDVCGNEIVKPDSFTTGYGVDTEGRKVCYQCCAIRDREDMRNTGKAVLYLATDDKGRYQVTNWPGSLKIGTGRPRIGKHNWAGFRLDVWFAFEGRVWHGTQYGGYTQLCHCKRTKAVA